MPDTLWCCQVFMSFWSGTVSYFCTKYANVCLMDIIRSLEWMIRSAAEEMIQSLSPCILCSDANGMNTFTHHIFFAARTRL